MDRLRRSNEDQRSAAFSKKRRSPFFDSTKSPRRDCGGDFLWKLDGPPAQALAFLAISHSWVKAAALFTANSASILRLISTPAAFRPCIKVE